MECQKIKNFTKVNANTTNFWYLYVSIPILAPNRIFVDKWRNLYKDISGVQTLVRLEYFGYCSLNTSRGDD